MLLRNFLNNCKVVQFALVLLVSFLFVSAATPPTAHSNLFQLYHDNGR
jgi:hypothetical protein